jgi:condensin complex subunit 1
VFAFCSSEFCEQQLQLMFTILEKSPSEIIRANSIIALGDLTFRFPNLIEPWTPHLYGRYVALCVMEENNFYLSYFEIY